MLSMIPFPYKLLAGAALIAGVFFYGYMKGSAYADAELARYGQKQAELVAELEKKNTEITTPTAITKIISDHMNHNIIATPVNNNNIKKLS